MRPAWPSLPFEAWKDAYATLHLWLQIAGKIRLAQCPWVNHQWHVTLQVTARGLTTRPIPHGRRVFQLDFDFIDHRLLLHASDGRSASLPLEPQSVAAFYRKLMALLADLDLPVRIRKTPNELEQAIPFDQDEVHRGELGKHLVEPGLRRTAQLMHQRPAVARGDQHLGRAGMAVLPAVLPWHVDVEGVVGVLDGGHPQAVLRQQR